MRGTTAVYTLAALASGNNVSNNISKSGSLYKDTPPERVPSGYGGTMSEPGNVGNTLSDTGFNCNTKGYCTPYIHPFSSGEHSVNYNKIYKCSQHANINFQDKKIVAFSFTEFVSHLVYNAPNASDFIVLGDEYNWTINNEVLIDYINDRVEDLVNATYSDTDDNTLYLKSLFTQATILTIRIINQYNKKDKAVNMDQFIKGILTGDYIKEYFNEFHIEENVDMTKIQTRLMKYSQCIKNFVTDLKENKSKKINDDNGWSLEHPLFQYLIRVMGFILMGLMGLTGLKKCINRETELERVMNDLRRR
jgi:hypothetical protein